MDPQTYSSGAMILLAVLPILLLAMHLRRRQRHIRSPALIALGVVSLVLLGTGIALATGNGAF